MSWSSRRRRQLKDAGITFGGARSSAAASLLLGGPPGEGPVVTHLAPQGRLRGIDHAPLKTQPIGAVRRKQERPIKINQAGALSQ